MRESDPNKVLLIHNRWATRNLLEACASLSDEQFHQEFDMSLGTLHNVTTHVLGAMRGWTDVLTERDPPRERLEGETRSIAELLDLLDEVADEFDAAVEAHPTKEEVSASRGDKTYTFTRGGILTHVTTHGMHHRAQCLNMLRRLGVEKLPPSSVLEWMLE